MSGCHLVGVLEELARRLPKGMAIVTGRPRLDCEYFLLKHGWVGGWAVDKMHHVPVFAFGFLSDKLTGSDSFTSRDINNLKHTPPPYLHNNRYASCPELHKDFLDVESTDGIWGRSTTKEARFDFVFLPPAPVFSSRLSHLFKASVCMEDGPAKPDPFPVTRAIELLGINPTDTAMVNMPTPLT